MSAVKARAAYNAGYRVKYNSVYSPRGRRLSLDTTSHPYYPRFSTSVMGVRFSVYCHKLAAYQLFGDRCFGPNIVVRHKNDNTRSFKLGNISLGSREDNLDDMYINRIVQYWMKLIKKEGIQ